MEQEKQLLKPELNNPFFMSKTEYTPWKNFSNFFPKNDKISNFCSHFSIGVYEKIYWVFIYDSKYIFSDTNAKI